MDAQTIIDRARVREAARPGPQPIDYDAANKAFRRQKSALTRAVNSGDPEKIIRACHKAVNEWESGSYPWPDDWARWQRALDDCFPVFQAPDLRDLID